MKIKRVFPKETGREIKKKGKKSKKNSSARKKGEREKKEKGFFLKGLKPFTRLTLEATVLWNEAPKKVTAPFVSLQSDSERT